MITLITYRFDQSLEKHFIKNYCLDLNNDIAAKRRKTHKKHYLHIGISNSYERQKHESVLYETVNNSSVLRFVFFTIVHSTIIWLFIDLERV